MSEPRPLPDPQAPTPVTAGREAPASALAPTLAAPTTGKDTDPQPPSGTPMTVPVTIGSTVDDFEILAELGRGGMGVVYQARQRSLDRLVALKMLLPEHAANDTLRARFLAEARAAAGLNHPNIVTVYQVGESRGGPYFAMEFIDGQTLEAVLRKQQVPIAWTINLLISVAEAVGYAHRKGIVHRDLKPANLMLDQGRRPVVMDFGIAKQLGKSAGLTHQGTIVGTPAYMAPEQAGERWSEVGAHSDVYSLGAILYNLVTGQVPFDGGSALKTILRVISDDKPPPPRTLRPELPGSLERLCLKCLSKKPADRYADGQALAEDLRRVRAACAAKKDNGERVTLPSLILVVKETGKPMRLTRRVHTVGRASDCDIVLRAADVSKRHCRIVIEPSKVLVEDLGSANGTFINDTAVQRAALKDGDELRVADHVFQVRLRWPRSKRS